MASNVIESAGSGDRRATLEALRDHLARALVEGGPGVAAQIAGQLRSTLAELDELDDGGSSRSAVDALAARRARRRAG